VEQTPRERALHLLRLVVFGWRPTETQLLWTIRLAIIFCVFILLGYEFEFTFGEWYPLFIIPALLAAAGYWFNRAQSNRQQQVEEQRAQNSAVQEYLNAMKELLLDANRPLRDGTANGMEARRLARARTFTVLDRLDGARQGSVVRFLSEAGLINRGDPVIALGGTRRRQPRLVGLDQRDGDTPMPTDGLGEYALTLGGCKLEKINLQGADLSGTDLSHVDLNFADLTGADLTDADLSGSLLVGANLIGADLGGATLDNAVFQWANLYQANITDDVLHRLVTSGALMGVILPDGSRVSLDPKLEGLLRKRPESELAQRERELGQIARLLGQQAR
jgi:uncharacterized protein YjbI with pentapeptide repeats